jgi:hypothetical protein
MTLSQVFQGIENSVFDEGETLITVDGAKVEILAVRPTAHIRITLGEQIREYKRPARSLHAPPALGC